MFAKISKIIALGGADRVLESRSKVMKALRREEQKLQQLIAERVEADRGLVDAETAAALGEGGNPSSARAKVDAAVLAIRRQSAVVDGVRIRIAALGTDIERERRAVKGMLGEHAEKVKADFAEEWERGKAAFRELLAKRKAVEDRVGKMVDLSGLNLNAWPWFWFENSRGDERPAPAELPASVTAPWQAIEELDSAIDELAGWARTASMASEDAVASMAFDPDAVYVLARDWFDIPAGAYVMEASFTPGALRYAVSLGHARRVTAEAWDRPFQVATVAANRIASERATEAEAQAAREGRQLEERAAAAVPVHRQRPEIGEHPDRKREREALERASERVKPLLEPPHVGTMS